MTWFKEGLQIMLGRPHRATWHNCLDILTWVYRPDYI